VGLVAGRAFRLFEVLIALAKFVLVAAKSAPFKNCPVSGVPLVMQVNVSVSYPSIALPLPVVTVIESPALILFELSRVKVLPHSPIILSTIA